MSSLWQPKTVLLVLGILNAVTEPAVSQIRAAIRTGSIPVSPSVVATAVTSEGRLILLVLWRGAPRWYSSGISRSASGGGDQSGKINVSLDYGDHQVELSFDSAAHTAIVQGKARALSPATNVLLVDNIDTPGGEVIKVLSIDPANVDLHPRLGLSAWAPLLARSREVVEFLQCDAVPVHPQSLEPCQYLRGR